MEYTKGNGNHRNSNAYELKQKMIVNEKRFPHYTSIDNLSKVKKIALRRGVWYKILNRLERGIVDLTITYLNKIKSSTLAHILLAITEKLQATTQSVFNRTIQTLGFTLSRRISSLAVGWNNVLARNWASDITFATFLVMMNRQINA
jgi:hypothetical protein